jgi:hypothetical protein
VIDGQSVQVNGVPGVAEVDHHERGYSASDHVDTMARGVFAKKCRFIESGLRQCKTNVRFGS